MRLPIQSPSVDRTGEETDKTGTTQFGLVREGDKGIGDVVSRIAVGMGFRPCEGCNRRAAALNSWFPFQ